MAISFIGAASAAANTVALPAHQVNDLLIGYAFRDGSTTAPTLPNSWSFISAPTGTSCSARIFCRFATSSSETNPVATNATGIAVHVYRGVTRVGAFANGSGSSNSISYPALTRQITNGTSWGVRFAGHRTATNLTTNAPSTVPNTPRTGVANEIRGLDSNGPLSANPTAGTQSVSASSGWIASTVELVLDTELPNSDLYVASYFTDVVKKLTPTGIESTLAFTGLDGPRDVAVDSGGNVYVASSLNNVVKKLTPAGVESTLAFTGLDGPYGVAVDSSGNVYVASYNTDVVKKLTPAGVESTLAFTGLDGPRGVVVDSGGNVYVASSLNNVVKKLTPAGVESTLAFTGLDGPYGVAVDSSGNIYVASYNTDVVKKLTPTGIESTLFAGLDRPYGVAVDSGGNVYVGSDPTDVVKKLIPAGVESTLAFIGLDAPTGLAVPPNSGAFFAMF